MKMSVFRMLPCDHVDVLKLEAWFTSRAAVGEHFERFRGFGVRFRKGEPMRVRYRLEPIPKGERQPSTEQLLAYEEAGWSYAGLSGDGLYVYRTEDPAAEELHSDPVVQSETYRYLCKRLSIGAYILLGSVIWMAAIMYFGVLRNTAGPLLYIAENPVFFLSFLMQILLAASAVRRMISVAKLRRRLAGGLVPEHYSGEGVPGRSFFALEILVVAVSVVVMVTSILSLVNAERLVLTQAETAGLPYVPLAVIEGNEALQSEPEFHVYEQWSPFLPRQMELTEYALPEARMWESGPGSYSPSAYTTYYKLAISATGSVLFSHLLADKTDYGFELEFRELGHPAFRRAVLVTEPNYSSVELYLLTEDDLFYVRYYGDADLTASLDSFAEMLAEH